MEATNEFNSALLAIREELDEHLESINQNTNEIRANHIDICELEAKIEKLSDRLDELFMILSPDKLVDYSSIKLTRAEQEVFLVLFHLEGPLTPAQVAKHVGLTPKLAAQYLYNLQLKGVPIIARHWNDELFYSIDLKFKDLQARKNILRIPSDVIKSVGSLFIRR